MGSQVCCTFAKMRKARAWLLWQISSCRKTVKLLKVSMCATLNSIWISRNFCLQVTRKPISNWLLKEKGIYFIGYIISQVTYSTKFSFHLLLFFLHFPFPSFKYILLFKLPQVSPCLLTWFTKWMWWKSLLAGRPTYF